MSARGPLPANEKRRRNAPAIPTTSLPASGRKGPTPTCPTSYQLRKNGKAWWRWAWSTPQAAAWDAGARYSVARRASLEDDLAALDHFDPFDLATILGVPETDRMREVSSVIGRLKGLAGDRIKVMREMRELDNKLGLSPEALSRLRWTIVDDGEEQKAKPAPRAKKANARRSRLTVVGA